MKKEANKTEIPGWAFIAVGIVVSAVSITMNIINDNQSMSVFIFVGVGMLGWGLAKIFLFGRKAKADFDVLEEESKEKKENSKQKISHPSQKKVAVKHCPKCGYALHKTDNFCYNCGTDVRNL